MIIEINKDIDRYQESVVFGLSAKQLVFSAVSLISGAGLILLLYRYIGFTASAYVAIPVVAPIALGGFYTYNGMSFYEVMGRKFRFAFANKALVYSSTEGEPAIRKYEQGRMEHKKSWLGFLMKSRSAPKTGTEKGNIQKSKEDFEAIKRKTRKLIICCIGIFAVAIVGAVIYKNMR